MRPNPRGKAGEDHAAAALTQLGCEILARNYRSPYGEVDIITRDGETICFVEVKTRRLGAQVSGAQAVGATKQRRIIQTALLYLQEHPCQWQPRFDVFLVETGPGGRVERTEYLTGAFDSEAYNQSPQSF